MTPGVLRSQLLCSTCFIAFQGARAGLCQSRFFAQMSPGCGMGAPRSELGMLEGETAVPTVLGENHPHPLSPMSPEARCLEIPSAFPHIPPGSLNKRDSAWLYREHRGDEGREDSTGRGSLTEWLPFLQFGHGQGGHSMYPVSLTKLCVHKGTQQIRL